MVDVQHENPYKLPATFHVAVEWPHTLPYKGKEYWRTGKEGVDMKTHTIPAAEYSCCYNHPKWGECEARIWLDANGNIQED